MSETIFADDAIRAATLALKGLTARHEVISNNVANVDTPGYSAQKIDFETTLKRTLNQSSSKLAILKTDAFHLESSPSIGANFLAKSNRLGGSTREDGNNVDIDTELIDMSETNIKYQAISQGLSSKLLLLKTIAQGG